MAHAMHAICMMRTLVSVATALLVACGGSTPPRTAQPGAGVPDTALPITHELAGKEDCTSCHRVGGGKKPLPESHQGRDNAVCTGCHHPKAG
jgi:predicted CXXCH cytochrome family protein